MKAPKFIEVDGIRTRYFEEGNGEPLVLIHGGNIADTDNVDLADNWGLNWPMFAKSFHVYALDKLGQGYTDLPKRDEDYNFGCVVGHAYGFVRALGLKETHLVGHSRGGYVSARLALEYPDLVKSLTIVDSSTIAPGENFWSGEERDKGKRGQLLAAAPRALLSKESIRWVTEKFSYSAAHITDDWLNVRTEVGSLPKTALAVDKMGKLMSTVLLPHLAKQKEETLLWIKQGRLKVPTLLVWGKNDPSAVLSGGLALFYLVAGSTKRAQMHIFNQAGHYSYREHPEDFARVVTSFINNGKLTR